MDWYVSIVKFFQEGGVFMYPIVLVFAFGFVIMVERWVFLTGAGTSNRRIWTKVMPLVTQGRYREADDIVQDTVRNMSLEDVRGILEGGDDAATQYLRQHAGPQLREAVLPIVSSATDSAGATSGYKALKGQADGAIGGLGGLGGLVDTGSLDLDAYVADKTLDGLFVKLAAEEKAIRENPAARTSDILKTVFGS